jgi:hypothetical protein
LVKKFDDYRIIYVTNKSDGKYLIRDISRKLTEPEYFKTDSDLKLRSVYLLNKKTNEFLLMEPYMYYIQCKYHNKKELFVFSNTQYDEYSGKDRSHYVGEYFMCSPLVPPAERINLKKEI